MNLLPMNLLLPFCILLFHSFCVIVAQTYKAGVVLYKPVVPRGETPDVVVAVNRDQYVKLMSWAKGKGGENFDAHHWLNFEGMAFIRKTKVGCHYLKSIRPRKFMSMSFDSNYYMKLATVIELASKVDILVFPEYGLTTSEAMFRHMIHLDPDSIVVGEVKTQVCESKNNSNLAHLACAAKANNLYVIVNLVEKHDQKFYITNVGLDPTGAICLKCRKQHLYNGTHFNAAPDTPNSCTFDANFKSGNVSFSVLFDTDMLYSLPAKKENVIMTSSIKNDLPFGFSLGLQSGFAIGNNVNLLVSGLSELENNLGGSGIYHKNGTIVVGVSGEGTADALEGSAIIVEEIHASAPDSQKINVEAKLIGQKPSRNLPFKNVSVLDDQNKNVPKYCLDKDKEFCCTFSAEIAQDSIEPYRWVAIWNTTTILDQAVKVLICALIKPDADKPALSFKNVAISSNLVSSKILQTLPLALNKDLVPLSFVYETVQGGTSVTLSTEEELFAFGIIHVIPSGSDASVSPQMTLMGVLLVVAWICPLLWR